MPSLGYALLYSPAPVRVVGRMSHCRTTTAIKGYPAIKGMLQPHLKLEMERVNGCLAAACKPLYCVRARVQAQGPHGSPFT